MSNMIKLRNGVGLILIGIGLLLGSATGVYAQDSLLLTGRATNVRVVEDKQDVTLHISLDLTITNTSRSNVILFWRDDPAMVDHWIYQSTDPMRRNLLFLQSGWPSTSRSPFWTDLQKQLNVAIPPPNLTRTLRSGGSINFSRETAVMVYKKTPFPGTWDEIAASPTVWLTVALDMFPGNLDQATAAQKSFGKKLKKKWADLGTLQIEVLTSAPIKLDVRRSPQ